VDAVVAALRLGDIGLLGIHLDWLEEMGSHARVASETLFRYLDVYRQAAEEHLGERAALVVDYLAQRMQRAPESEEPG
jgi:hypothetical protein